MIKAAEWRSSWGCHRPDAGPLADTDEVTVDVAGVEWPPDLRRENQPRIHPGLPHGQSLLCLADLCSFRHSITG